MLFFCIKKCILKCKYGRNVIFFSLGENCLTDNILSRYELKSFSSPYSSGRSNIEYILYFEKEEFKNFLNLDYLKYDYFNDKKVVRNTLIKSTVNNYEASVMNGFEFTHHDIISDSNLKRTMRRRCNRLINLKNKKIYMLYHHRLCENTNEELLFNHFQELKEIYKQRNNDVFIYFFTQKIVLNDNERRIEKFKLGNDIYKYVLYTLNKWEGENQDIFWARCDDDLIKVMINDIKTSAKNLKKISKLKN